MNVSSLSGTRSHARRRARHSFRGLLETLETRLALSTFVVSSTGDAPAVDPSKGAETAAGTITLRSAIQAANAHPNDGAGPDRIEFLIPGPGVQTIVPSSSFPAITDPIVIDGYTQPGASPNTLGGGDNAALKISIDGTTSVRDGLAISAGSSTVRGLVLTNFAGHAITLSGKDGNVVAGNFIGIVASGDVARGNGVGVDFAAGADGNTIGGVGAADRNVISGNTTGVLVEAGAKDSIIRGNFIGTDATGGLARQNGAGIDVRGDNSTIADNLVSASTSGAGITLRGVNVGLIQGNLIGTDATGTRAISNVYGIVLDGSNFVTIGGTTAAARNVVSGNGFTAIYLQRFGIGTQIQGNFIGTDISGTKRLTNNGDGILIDFTDPTRANRQTIIGGVDPSAGNTIAFNGANGIEVRNSTAVAKEADGEIQANRIFSNSRNGIVLAHGNVADPRYRISRNSIFSNSFLGIDLGDDGVTPNDSKGHVGPNNYQNFPTLTTVTTSETATNVSGTLKSAPNLLHFIEFFANTEGDSSGHGEGQTFLGTTLVTTDAAGNASFDNVALPPLPTGQTLVTATATDGDGRTSEFSGVVNAGPAQAAADLSIAMTAAPDPVPLGANLTYTITITNNGPGGADNVKFTTAVPDRSTFVSFSLPPGWTANNPGAGGTGNVSAAMTRLESGATAVLSFVVRVADFVPSTDLLTALGTVTSDTADPTTSNNTASASASVPRPPDDTDLAIAVSAGPKSVPGGQALTYTITATNNGPIDAGNNSITVTLPSQTTYRSVAAPSGWDTQLLHDGGTDKLIASFRNLEVDASAVLTVTVIVNPTATVGSTMTAIASIVSETLDSNPANNRAQDSARVAPAPAASVAVAISGNMNRAKVGEVVTYTATISNPSGVAATGVVLHLAVPGTVRVVSAGGVSQRSAGLNFNVGTLAAGQSRQFQIRASSAVTGKITLTARAAADPGVTVGGPASVTTAVIATPSGDPQPLTVLNSVRYGFHKQPTILVVTFSQAVNPDQASDPANYLVSVRANGLVRAVPVGAIAYNSVTHQATLRMARHIDIHAPWWLTVRGHTHDLSGRPLVTDGVAGRDFVTRMDIHSLVGPASLAPGASRVGVIAVPAGPLASQSRNVPKAKAPNGVNADAAR